MTDGENLEDIQRKLDKAKEETKKHSLVIVHTIIGYGSKNQGTSKVHGSPLGEADGNHAKEVYGFKGDKFEVPAEVYEDTLQRTRLKEEKKHTRNGVTK